LWLLSELYENLPEVGDAELPKLVFFFDEAHMLFNGTSKALVDKIEQIVRLIRSKGIGVYFITQSPTDIPEEILGQLGNRVQHALRAFTPKDQKAVRSAAQTFRANPAFSTEEAIMELGTGEALVSFLDPKGAPSVVERAKILFPLSQIGAITDEERRVLMASAPVGIRAYDAAVDRLSAYEVLTEQNAAAEKEAAAAAQAEEEAKRAALEEKEEQKKKRSGVGRGLLGTLIGAATTSFIRSVSTSMAKSLVGGSSSSKKKSTGKSIVGKAAQTAATTATRKIVNETIKSLLK
jgi:DNA helicase HerA-like ATPase